MATAVTGGDRRILLRRTAIGVLAAAVVAGAVGMATSNRSSAGVLADGVSSIDVMIAVLGIVCSALAMANRGLLNRAAHHAVGLDAGVASMTQTAAVGFAAQKMVKSAGAVGLAVFVRRGKHAGHPPTAVAAACVLTASASFASLGVLMATAVLVLALSGGMTGWWLAAAAGFSIYAVAVLAAAVVVARNRHVANRLWHGVHRARRRLPWGSRPDAVGAFPDELLDAVATAKTRPTAVRGLVLHAIAAKALGALTLVAAVAAVGLPVSLTTTIVIYATALAASLVTIVPGGIGTVEASTAALLIGAGATAGAAALAVALFRFFDLWLPVLTGAVVARRELRREQRITDRAHDPSTSVALMRMERRSGLN